MATKSAATKTVQAKSKVVRPGMPTPQKESEAPEKEGTETPDAPLPVLDLSDAAVKKMIKQAKKRGYVTYEQLNAVMPSEEVTSEKIEDVLAMMNEMGINVVETEEADNDDEEEGEEEESEGAISSRSRPRRRRNPRPASPPSAPTIRCACICAKWVRSSCCRGKAKSPSPSASRPAAKR